MCKDLAGYHKRPEALPGFEQLETAVELRWMSGSQGLVNREDFWDVVSRGAHVHRAEVESLGERVVKLSNGEEILDATADTVILSRFPNLANAPRPRTSLAPRTPYRLHRNMVPLDDPSIIFLGHITSPNAFLTAPVQALWAYAYLNEEVKFPP